MPLESSNTARWFADEVQVHASVLKAWLKGRYPSIIDPENIVQESLTRVWHLGEKTQIQSPKALLFTTANNLALDQVRRCKVVQFEPIAEASSLSVLEDGPSPADTTAHNQELELLTQAIQTLPDRCRQVLTLRKIYGLSQKEIALQLDISEHTVEAQVANGVRRCTEFLARHGLP